MTRPRPSLQVGFDMTRSEPPPSSSEPDGDVVVPMDVLGAIEQESDDISLRYIDQLLALSGGDPYAQLVLIRVGLEAVDRHTERLKALRLEIAQRLREDGDPMTEIAEAAGVNDSYLARLIIKSGGARRSDRTRRRRRRRQLSE